MSTHSRRSSATSSPPGSKRTSVVENGGKKVTAVVKPQLAKKRPALSNITNIRNGGHSGGVASVHASSKIMVPCAAKIAKMGKKSISTKSTTAPIIVDTVLPSPNIVTPAPGIVDVSPSRSGDGSMSLDETMSTCDSMQSPEYEYIDTENASAVQSIEKKTSNILYITEHAESEVNARNRDILTDVETVDQVDNIDHNITNPQFCAAIACDVYKHLRASEAKKRHSVDYMERVQKDINASMRGVLIDWLVEVAEEYRLLPDTLFLAVNYVDRYLSVTEINRQQLQLLGVACMMIAAKYEEICVPKVEEFCYVTDNTYRKEEVLQMEYKVLNCLQFEMTAPTARCFLRRFIRAAQYINEVPSMQFESLANYLAELSLIDYRMLCYSPSLIAASATFLAKIIIFPSKKPWNSTLEHYTLYRPSDLCDCVKALHCLCCNSDNSGLIAIREKYSQHKYKFVAKKYCPSSIPPEFFQDLSSS